ncbi:LytTR family DNA-binding domain-containing protein [Bacillus xiapuensis]|uniref:LytTR family DNA-binding domain-containing protein n=1 Tax=Bacillus xiapuensis TaxID=2014075 RepID=UPI000C233F3B|nr:LytTR family DNA-binding domain-containing protein [Bacillus xiapuensis]
MKVKIKEDRLVIIKRSGVQFIFINEIMCIERFNQKTIISSVNEEIIIRTSLKELEYLLPSFLKRVHRSFIINVDKILEIKRINENTFEALLPGDNQALITKGIINYII